MVSSQSSQAFCLKLNSHQTHLIEAFQKLYNDEVMVDCTLSCQGGTLKAHKLVLSACSPYFTNLFSTFTNPYQYPVVILKDMPFSDLKAIIEFMYRGEVTVPQTSLPSVLDSAKTLMVTGLCDIKIANIETPTKNDTVGTAKQSSGRRSRKRRRQLSDKAGGDSQEGESIAGDSEHSEVEASEGETSEKQLRDTEDVNAGASVDMPLDDGDGLAQEETEEMDQTLTSGESIDTTGMNSSQAGPSGVAHNLRSGQKLTPSAAMKANLRQARIEKLQAITGGLSGRKMWSEEETRALVRVWEEESARVWASAGKKVLSLKRISDLLQSENIDRDVSQVEGKIKALKRDYKAVKADRAIPSVQARMAPYLDKLDAVFSRDEI